MRLSRERRLQLSPINCLVRCVQSLFDAPTKPSRRFAKVAEGVQQPISLLSVQAAGTDFRSNGIYQDDGRPGSSPI